MTSEISTIERWFDNCGTPCINFWNKYTHFLMSFYIFVNVLQYINLEEKLKFSGPSSAVSSCEPFINQAYLTPVRFLLPNNSNRLLRKQEDCVDSHHRNLYDIHRVLVWRDREARTTSGKCKCISTVRTKTLKLRRKCGKLPIVNRNSKWYTILRESSWRIFIAFILILFLILLLSMH